MPKLTGSDRKEMEARIERLTEIQSEMVELTREVSKLLRPTSEYEYAKGYWLSSLQIALSDEHGYVTRDSNLGDTIQTLTDQLNGTGDYADEDEEDSDV